MNCTCQNKQQINCEKSILIYYVPLDIASKLLGVSPRQLSKLVAEGREPFCLIGANIGTRQKYVRIYTGRLIAYLNGEPL